MRISNRPVLPSLNLHSKPPLFRTLWTGLSLFVLAVSTAHAGLTMELHLLRYDHGNAYRFFTPLTTNSTPPAAAFGTYLISSPLYSTNSSSGSWRAIQVDANGANTVNGSEASYADFNSLMNQLTNGPWTIVFTNNATTNVYTFHISAPTATSNMLPAVVITYPSDNQLNTPNQPTMTWQSPPGSFPASTANTYLANYDFSIDYPLSFPPGQNSWPVPAPLPDGANCFFNVSYLTNNVSPVFLVSTPINTNSSQNLAGWGFFDTWETGDTVGFAVTNPPALSTTLLAHYPFDNSGNLGKDTSGNGYDLDFNGGNGVVSTNDAWLGGSAAYFDGNSFFSYTSPPTNLLHALAGDFSISFWIKTTQDDGNEDGEAFAGAGIVAADVPGSHFDLVPAALDGGQIGFNTGLFDDTLNSTNDVNTPGSGYHHVVVTRNQTTGEKQIYIDGVFNQNQFGTLNPLTDPRLLAVGCAIDASQSDPNNADPHQFFQGALDDLQIYSGVLSSVQVLQLFRGTGSESSLVAHYTFDNATNIGADTSGHGLDLDFNGGNGVTLSTDAETGGGAADFDGGSFLSYNAAPNVVLSTFAGDFTLSFWIKTTQNDGNQNGPAWAGDGIVTADIPFGPSYDIIPAALDGGQIGFNTGPNDDTLNSHILVSDGAYHHVVVTRNQGSGQKQVYIDGALDNSDIDNTNLLNDPVLIAVGCKIDASQSDANNADPTQFLEGRLDDLQIYSRVLTSSEISFLHLNPGTTVKTATTGHRNVAHYSFDNGTALGEDSSGNGNDMSGVILWGPREQAASDAAAGSGSLQLFGTSALTAPDHTRSNLDAVLAGSFSFSTWVKTTVTNGSDGNNAFFGGVIFWAYNDHNNTNDTIPLSVTGNRAAFTTRGTNSGQSDTVHSLTRVNDGNYHLLTVTRDGSTGEKKLYVDGHLEDSQISTAVPLNGNDYYMSIGGFAYILEQTATVTNYSSYSGLLDDLQIYSGVLSANDAMYLYQHPGSTVPDVNDQDYNAALNTAGLNWSSGGDASWFTENTVTHDGVSAVQSGQITDSQATHLDVTVIASGQISFFWKVSSEQNFDFLHFSINGIEKDSISGEVDWSQKSYAVSAGDVLRWEYTKDDSDSDGLDAGFLDQISFSAGLGPVITVNPFNQTNYPGYGVALLAGATGNPNPSFQWYKTGLGAITGATNALYVPTNSGTAGVAGNYYAIASNLINSAITTTAAVAFVSAPLPPDWAKAFKSPFQAQDASLVFSDYYLGMAFDGSASNNIYTATEFGGNVAVGATQLSSGANNAAAVVKQTTNGLPLWIGAITNNGAGNSSGRAVASAPGGGVYLGGNFTGTNFINGTPVSNSGNLDVFLSRFDANGNNLWTRTIGGTNDDFIIINGLASDPAGNVTIAGLFGSGPVSIGTSNYNITGQEGFVAQYDQSGALRWSQILPGEFVQHVTSSAGRLYLGMNTAGGTSILFSGITNATDRSWAIVCANSGNGQLLWARGLGAQSGNSNPNPYSSGVIDDVPRIVVSGADVFVTGVAYDTNASFGSLTVNFPLPRGEYLARYDTNGNAQVAVGYGSVTTTPFAAAADSAGNVYISGDFDTAAYFGTNLLAAPTNRRFSGDFGQAFLAKFDRNGNAQWARPAISPATVVFRGIGLASDGIWAVGVCISTNTSTGYSPTAFGTNFVFSDTQAIVSGSGIGTVTFTGYPSGVLAKIADIVPMAALPVTLNNTRNTGTNFQFSFPSQNGFTHSVQYRTNLFLGTDWQTYTNIPGDGSSQTIPVPYSVFSPSKIGFLRVTTH